MCNKTPVDVEEMWDIAGYQSVESNDALIA